MGRSINGFTLVQTMIVVGLIGLIATMSVVGYSEIRRRVRNKQAAVQLEILRAAIEQLAWDTGYWPNREQRNGARNLEFPDLNNPKSGLLSNDDDFYPNWKGPYIDDIPLDPWGTKYFFDPDYRVDGNMRVVVGTFGENRVGMNRYDQDDLVLICDKEKR